MDDHIATLHSNVESVLHADHQHVAITKHGIAACREIVVEGNGDTNSLSFTRVMSPTDLLDKTDVFIFDCDGVIWKGASHASWQQRLPPRGRGSLAPAARTSALPPSRTATVWTAQIASTMGRPPRRV